MEQVKENVFTMYRAVLKKAHARELYLRLIQLPQQNRAQERWLNAAEEVLSHHAQVEADAIGNITTEDMENPEEEIEIKGSKDAMLGVKLTIVKGITGYHNGQMMLPPANLVVSRYLRKIADAFGKKFRALVEIESKLPENPEDDKMELDLSEDASE